MASQTEQLLNSRIDESELILYEVIGRGASADIYRALWTIQGHEQLEVAVKKMGKTKDDIDNDHIRKEILFLQSFKHENIIKYYGYVETERCIMIVMEYAAKGSLYKYLKTVNNSLPQDLKLKWMREAALAIQYLEEQHVFHGDLKSANYVITAQNTLKLCDFGLAKYLPATDITQHTTGSIKWQAPEVFIDGIMSLKANIFALAIIMWELETCEEPYKGKHPGKIMWEVGTYERRPFISDKFSPRIAKLIQLCWHQDRLKRPGIEFVIEQIDLNKIDDGHHGQVNIESPTYTTQHSVHNSPSSSQKCQMPSSRFIRVWEPD